MRGSLKVKIEQPLPLTRLLELAATQIKLMLRSNQNFTVGVQIPCGAPFSEVPSEIPDHPRWGLYFHLEGIDESLVEANLSTLSDGSNSEPVVLNIHELRTPASKVLAVGLAIAAGRLLGQNILDHEQMWTKKDEISSSELQAQLTVDGSHDTLGTALAAFTLKMNRTE